MISTKWFQGSEKLNDAMIIRKKVFCDELNLDEKGITDFYDEFAFNAVVYDDNLPIGTGRLFFKDGRYLIDKICVIKEFRKNNYSDLIIRMLIRKAVTIGAEKTYSCIDKKYKQLFAKVGFEEIGIDENNNLIMMKSGDVGGHCC